MIHLDTHVVVWLYQQGAVCLPARAREELERSRPCLSPMGFLELGYLHEVGRLRPTAEAVLAELRTTLGLRLAASPFEEVARRALSIRWTRDPFDRLIVAQAEAEEARLVTKDRSIHEHFPLAVWS